MSRVLNGGAKVEAMVTGIATEGAPLVACDDCGLPKVKPATAKMGNAKAANFPLTVFAKMTAATPQVKMTPPAPATSHISNTPVCDKESAVFGSTAATGGAQGISMDIVQAYTKASKR